jgi:hypothetical protein
VRALISFRARLATSTAAATTRMCTVGRAFASGRRSVLVVAVALSPSTFDYIRRAEYQSPMAPRRRKKGQDAGSRRAGISGDQWGSVGISWDQLRSVGIEKGVRAGSPYPRFPRLQLVRSIGSTATTSSGSRTSPSSLAYMLLLICYEAHGRGPARNIYQQCICNTRSRWMRASYVAWD